MAMTEAEAEFPSAQWPSRRHVPTRSRRALQLLPADATRWRGRWRRLMLGGALRHQRPSSYGVRGEPRKGARARAEREAHQSALNDERIRVEHEKLELHTAIRVANDGARLLPRTLLRRPPRLLKLQRRRDRGGRGESQGRGRGRPAKAEAVSAKAEAAAAKAEAAAARVDADRPCRGPASSPSTLTPMVVAVMVRLAARWCPASRSWCSPYLVPPSLTVVCLGFGGAQRTLTMLVAIAKNSCLMTAAQRL